jgi:hypothetical protein
VSDPKVVDEILEHVSKQKAAYKELDTFEPGQGGLQYFPVPVEEWNAWKKEKDRKDMEAYEKRELEKQNNGVLELREELPRSNGHDKPQTTLYEGHPSLTTCNYCNNAVGKCNCNENPKFDKIKNPDHCELKKQEKKPVKKRVSKKK